MHRGPRLDARRLRAGRRRLARVRLGGALVVVWRGGGGRRDHRARAAARADLSAAGGEAALADPVRRRLAQYVIDDLENPASTLYQQVTDPHADDVAAARGGDRQRDTSSPPAGRTSLLALYGLTTRAAATTARPAAARAGLPSLALGATWDRRTHRRTGRCSARSSTGPSERTLAPVIDIDARGTPGGRIGGIRPDRSWSPPGAASRRGR